MNSSLASAPTRTAETTDVHTRLLKCALCIDESRAYWSHRHDSETPIDLSNVAFEQSWFGAKSQRWVSVLITNMRARFDAFPDALYVLHRWRDMTPETRRLICHFHLQLTDPMYRAFTGEYLPKRRDSAQTDIRRQIVIHWVADQGPGRWTVSTRTQLASRLLSCAAAAGLLQGKRDPRALVYPRVPDDALTYILHMLRAVDVRGTLIQNPYLASIGIEHGMLADRLRTLDAVDHYHRVGDVYDIEWHHESLRDWSKFAHRTPDAHTANSGDRE